MDDDDDERANLASVAAGFECHICLDIAKDAVVSLCGHLFCWPCLHQWLETRPTVQLCPVCKAGISKDKVVPLYDVHMSCQYHFLGANRIISYGFIKLWSISNRPQLLLKLSF